jgi:hypothetical protein
MRRVLVLLLALFALSVASPGYADASAPWLIWLYQPTCPAPKIVRVGLDGSASVQPFGCPDSGDFPSPVAFSADVSRMAYCKYGSVRIVDFAEDFNYHIDLNDDGDCSVTPQAFDRADKRFLAVGTTHYTVATDSAPSRAYGELLILDIDAVTISARLATDDDALAPYYRRSYPNTADMPYVRDFDAGRVVFSPIVWGSSLPTRFQPALGWQPGASTVTPTPSEGQWGENRLVTGESVWYDANPALPQARSSGVYNAVMWAAPGIEPRLVYTAPQAISNTLFIDGGQRIAFHAAPIGRPASWLALDRDGQTTALASAPLVGTPDGYLTLEGDGSGTRLYRIVGDGAPTLIWQDKSVGWLLAGSTPLPAPAESLPPFPAAAPK